MLRKVGRMLMDTTRQADVVCRFGGDEFAVLLPETGSEDAGRTAERIRLAVADISVPGEDEPGNVIGSPGLFGNAKDAEVFFDNVKVTQN